nr:uncharacterized protein LOC128685852 [Cherax quadricarinatus]
MPLPSTRILMVELELNDVNDAGVSEACHVVRKLHPKGRFWMIRCTNSTVTEVGIQHMIRGLARRRVKVNWLEIVTSVTITPEQQQPLITMAKTTLESRFTIHKCKTETSDHVTR